MSPPVICAAPDCDHLVVRHPGRVGRPPIYCSPACRPTHVPSSLTVEVDHDDTTDEEPGRNWVVRLRRGSGTVVVGRGFGRFSASALATELRGLIEGVSHGGEER